MLCKKREKQAQVSAFEAMLIQGNKEHILKASKTYNFDFFNEK